MTGNKSGRASVNPKAVNIMAQHRLATLRLPVRPGFAPRGDGLSEHGGARINRTTIVLEIVFFESKPRH